MRREPKVYIFKQNFLIDYENLKKFKSEYPGRFQLLHYWNTQIYWERFLAV